MPHISQERGTLSMT